MKFFSYFPDLVTLKNLGISETNFKGNVYVTNPLQQLLTNASAWCYLYLPFLKNNRAFYI